ncbi:MAG: DUF2203 family protein [Acidobacteriaceae bacterium]
MRTFTLDEAQWMLPTLRDLLQRAIDGKKTLETISQEFAHLSRRIFISGGMLPDLHYFAQRRATAATTAQSVQDALAEIQATGVQVKDLDAGLLDFPCHVNGEVVLLCWKFCEEDIAHYHGMEEGFRGRKPITEAIRSAGRTAH